MPAILGCPLFGYVNDLDPEETLILGRVDQCLYPNALEGMSLFSLMRDVEELKAFPIPGALGEQTNTFVQLWRLYRDAKGTCMAKLIDDPKKWEV